MHLFLVLSYIVVMASILRGYADIFSYPLSQKAVRDSGKEHYI